MIRHLTHAILGDRLARLHEKIDDAASKAARHKAEQFYYQNMSLFYAKRAAKLDPHKHWNEFAQAKQKEHDHLTDAGRERDKAEECEATVQALEQKLKTLKGEA